MITTSQTLFFSLTIALVSTSLCFAQSSTDEARPFMGYIDSPTSCWIETVTGDYVNYYPVDDYKDTIEFAHLNPPTCTATMPQGLCFTELELIVIDESHQILSRERKKKLVAVAQGLDGEKVYSLIEVIFQTGTCKKVWACHCDDDDESAEFLFSDVN